MAKCLVTGGCGFIGSSVVDLLISKGHEVTVIDNLSTGKIENLNPKAVFIESDIRHNQAVPIVDYVFHLASLARIQPSIDNPVESHDVNINGTLNILEYCRSNNAKLIFSSSSSIYEGSDLPTAEIDAVEPKNPYALQKWLCEQYITLYGKLYGMDYTILRYFNVYGERQILEGAYAAVVGIFLDQASKGKPLTVTGDGEQSRDFSYVKDVAKANLLAMDWKPTAYNIGTGKNYSMNQLAKMISDDITYLPKRQGEVEQTLAYNEKAKRAGWKSTKDIKGWIYEQT
jgi:UDP-glucose 4-epimerase